MIGSANRDPEQFRDAGRFDITRDPNPHVAFGHGIRFCIGAALSRLEGRIALSRLFERMKHIELVTDRPWERAKPCTCMDRRACRSDLNRVILRVV
jgi:cytochrome P450